jgi:hypothetical protein
MKTHYFIFIFLFLFSISGVNAQPKTGCVGIERSFNTKNSPRDFFRKILSPKTKPQRHSTRSKKTKKNTHHYYTVDVQVYPEETEVNKAGQNLLFNTRGKKDCIQSAISSDMRVKTESAHTLKIINRSHQLKKPLKRVPKNKNKERDLYWKLHSGRLNKQYAQTTEESLEMIEMPSLTELKVKKLSRGKFHYTEQDFLVYKNKEEFEQKHGQTKFRQKIIGYKQLTILCETKKIDNTVKDLCSSDFNERMTAEQVKDMYSFEGHAKQMTCSIKVADKTVRKETTLEQALRYRDYYMLEKTKYSFFFAQYGLSSPDFSIPQEFADKLLTRSSRCHKGKNKPKLKFRRCVTDHKKDNNIIIWATPNEVRNLCGNGTINVESNSNTKASCWKITKMDSGYLRCDEIPSQNYENVRNHRSNPFQAAQTKPTERIVPPRTNSVSSSI